MVSTPLPLFVSNHRATSRSESANDRRCNFPLFPSRRMRLYVPYSAELLHFIKRASLQGKVRNEHRFHQAGPMTVDSLYLIEHPYVLNFLASS